MYSANFTGEMQLPKKVFLLLLLLEIFVNFSGISNPFFSNDPALYAAISKAMVRNGNLWNLYVYGVDWLDKPHFPFWMAAISFKLFGISEFSYRLPALLFILLGSLYTFLLAKKLYSREVAQISVLILLSAQHLLMSNTDVRAEPYLLALVVGAVYHFHHLFQKFSVSHLLLGSLLAGCAVMTKGTYALIPIGTAILGQAIFTNRFKEIFQWRWIFAALLTIVFILPEVYAVYVQFDQHPEKIVFGKTDVSGIKWFLWDSQFSRFVNNGPITRPKGDIFYYVHTLLWAFAPWCLVFYFVLAKRLVDIFKRRKLREYLTISSVLPMLLFFSFSKFQLNFYTNILFPFFSILVASFISSEPSPGQKKFYSISQAVQSSVLLAGVVVINYLLHPSGQLFYFILTAVVISIALVVLLQKFSLNLKWLFISCLSVLYINFYLNRTLYRMMASYKGENQAAAFVNRYYPGKPLGVFHNTRNGFEFYSREPVQKVDLNQWISGADRERIFYIDDFIYSELISNHAQFHVLKEFPDYSSESISGKFIDAGQRPFSLHKGFLVQWSDF
jgi:4-amino-4-deoxy-L-arabinose transferase-like glycosyltransferase